MGKPTTALATLRPDLAGSMFEFDLAMQLRGFIGNRLFPTIQVAKPAGSLGKIPLKHLLARGDTKRAPGSPYGRGKFEFDDFAFACEEHGWEEPVDDNEAQMYADYFDAEQVSTLRAQQVVLGNQEDRIAAMLYNTSTYTGSTLTTAITNEWDDFANAVPVDDVLAASKRIFALTGMWPNTLVLNIKQFKNLQNCTQVINRINSAGAGDPSKISDITEAMVARVLGLQQIVVAGTVKNTANINQTVAPTVVWSDEYAFLCRVATTNDFREPCIGRTFHWAEDGSQPLGVVESYRDESVRSEIIRVRHQVDEVIMYTQMGHLLSNVTT